MRNELLKIGPVTIHGYGLMIAIGIFLAYIIAEYRAKNKHIESSHFVLLSSWAILGGLIGAKLLFWITQIKNIANDPKIILDLTSGFVVYGGILGGILSGYIYCKKKNINFLQYFDLCLPSVALAQGFGRIGCFLAGCCYGAETDSWFGITFHESCFAPNGVKLIPTQIISSVFDFVVFFVLIFIARKRKSDGLIGGLYLIFYSLGRFVIEFYRGDLNRGNVGMLSTSQLISVIVFALTCIVLFWKIRKSKSSSSFDITNK